MPIDYKRYPPNWKELRTKVLERAKNRCEFCGVPNYSVGFWNKGRWNRTYGNMWQDKAGWGQLSCREAREIAELNNENLDIDVEKKYIVIVLTIAHLDHDPENHSVSLDRLRALCQRCHLKYDKPIRFREKNQYNLFLNIESVNS